MLEEKKKNFDSYLEEHRENTGSVIHELWLSKEDSLWRQDPYFYIRLGSLADRMGQAMFAHDVVMEGLRHFPDDVRLTQLFALSQIKCGFLLEARDLLTTLVKKGHEDEETLGILGRVYKDMWQIAGEGERDHPYLQKSRNLYLKAFLNSRGYYSGINAASLSLIMDDWEKAERLARIVIKMCRELYSGEMRDGYWVLATLGEAYVILGRKEQAILCYRKARALIDRNFSELASTKRQLRLLRRYTDVDDAVVDTLVIPQVVAFSGHMIDAPGRNPSRFPAAAAAEVQDRIAAELDRLGAGIGYSSAGCGADILFLECLQERGGETNIILPFDRDDFFETSIRFAGPEWVSRAEETLKGSSQIIRATRGKYGGDDNLFTYANRIIMGRAILRSQMLETDAVLLAVWDGRDSKAPGGTSEFVRQWKSTGRYAAVVDIGHLRDAIYPASGEGRPSSGGESGDHPDRQRGGEPEAKRQPKQQPKRTLTVKRDTRALLFADIVGYSNLREEQFPWFVKGFLDRVAGRLKRMRARPLFRNVWGDAVYIVFENLVPAAEYALDLRDMVRTTDWTEWNLPADLSIRIGLHAGPVYYGKEPVLGKVNFFGSHVNQAARIEPITSPGNVYASEQFASLLMEEGNEAFECRYVGVVVLPKEFGSYPMYHLKRKSEIE